MIRHRSATCCGVHWADSHCSSCARSLGQSVIENLALRMGKASWCSPPYVKLFKRHYTSMKIKISTERNSLPATVFNHKIGHGFGVTDWGGVGAWGKRFAPGSKPAGGAAGTRESVHHWRAGPDQPAVRFRSSTACARTV